MIRFNIPCLLEEFLSFMAVETANYLDVMLEVWVITCESNSLPLEQCSVHPGWLFGMGDEKLPSYMGIILSQHQDPYQTTSKMESNKVIFFRSSDAVQSFLRSRV